jgi:hypothetical protein
MALCIVLGTAVFSRVLSLWMAKSLMNNDPIVHKIVKDDASARSINPFLRSRCGVKEKESC